MRITLFKRSKIIYALEVYKNIVRPRNASNADKSHPKIWYLIQSHETFTLITPYPPILFSVEVLCYFILVTIVLFQSFLVFCYKLAWFPFSINFLSSLCRTCANHADLRLTIYIIYMPKVIEICVCGIMEKINHIFTLSYNMLF